ncbi:MAG: glycosyltransferase [Patescibacteria group bacterium]
MSKKKTAIIYDWIDKWGGVERVLLTLHELYPDADFFTSYYDSKSADWAKGLNIQTTFIQNLPSFIKKSRLLSLLLYPMAFETFNLSDYKTVISVTSSFAKGVITKPQTRHICYLLTPPRYIWGNTDVYTKKSFITTIGQKLIGKYLKKWDFIAAQRVDEFISISKIVAERCKSYYKRDSKVIFPPFDLEYWSNLKKGLNEVRVKDLPKEFYLVVSRLEPYKRVDLVVDAFNDLPEKKLVVVGAGTEEDVLKSRANENTLFLNNLSDEQLALIYSKAKVLIMPQEEDFGYVALEAQFFGCPVLSYGNSGAKETVTKDKTGLFFDEQTKDALTKKLLEFDIISYELKESCIKYGETVCKQFSKEQFKQQLKSYKF